MITLAKEREFQKNPFSKNRETINARLAAAGHNPSAVRRPSGFGRNNPSGAGSCRARCRSRGLRFGSISRSKSLFALISSLTTSSVLYGGTLESIVPWASSSLPLRFLATSWLAWLS